MKKTLIIILLVTLISSLLACIPPASAQEVRSSKPRVTSPQTTASDLTALVNGNSAFAFDLYQSLSKQTGNLFFSPYSLSEALAMTYGGAMGTTAIQMAGTLHFTLDNTHLHPAFNSLDLALASRGKGAKGTQGSGFRLNIANATWGQKNYQFLPAYLDLLAQNYGAGMRILDYTKSPEDSRVTINKWVSDQTEDKIKDLIPQGVINTLTRLVLTNAIYFNAAWQYPFQKGSTSDGSFHLNNGTDVNVPMMRQTESFGYTEGDNYQAVELPYDGRELSMVILLPRAGQFNAFESSIDSLQISGIIGNLQPKEVALAMPKFQFDASFSLKQALSSMGMTDAFTDSADFSGMTGNRELYISDVIHKAFVSVDEEGTEAAAASAVIIGLTAFPVSVPMTIDRPFIFLIRDIQTGAIVFLGRVMDPSQ